VNDAQSGNGWLPTAAVKEKFLTSNLPPFETPEDYTPGNRPRLGNEYRAWLASADNWLLDRVVLAESPSTLRIAFPLPGTKFYLDPDLPDHGRRIHLRAEGPENLRWHSDSLTFEQEGGREIALLVEGRHLIDVSDPRSGALASTWIEVRER